MTMHFKKSFRTSLYLIQVAPSPEGASTVEMVARRLTPMGYHGDFEPVSTEPSSDKSSLSDILWSAYGTFSLRPSRQGVVLDLWLEYIKELCAACVRSECGLSSRTAGIGAAEREVLLHFCNGLGADVNERPEGSWTVERLYERMLADDDWYYL